MKQKIAYISRINYPSSSAHSMQTLRMAAEFAVQTGDTGLFVRSIIRPIQEILQEHAALDTPLQFWSLHLERVPAILQGYYSHPAIYNSMIAFVLALNSTWQSSPDCQKVLFNRGIHEYPYWGLMKPFLPWLKDWLLVYEAHDIAGLDELALGRQSVGKSWDMGQNTKRRLRALQSYDFILCVTQALADDLQRWSGDSLHPVVVRHASSLPRLDRPPITPGKHDKIVLGYTGSIDIARGVDTLLKAMRLLPEKFHLRLVGLNFEDKQYPTWLVDLMNDPDISRKVDLIPKVPLGEVMNEIDQCDILLQPASRDIISSRYRAPLKLFDYMARGKPIIAADVPCHMELLQEGVNACLYRVDDIDHLISQILFLSDQPKIMTSIACGAWKQAEGYTYEARTRRILKLVDDAWDQRIQAQCEIR